MAWLAHLGFSGQKEKLSAYSWHSFFRADERFMPTDVDGCGLLSVIFTLVQFAMSVCFTCVNLYD
jgi:hypothetical protein